MKPASLQILLPNELENAAGPNVWRSIHDAAEPFHDGGAMGRIEKGRHDVVIEPVRVSAAG